MKNFLLSLMVVASVLSSANAQAKEYNFEQYTSAELAENFEYASMQTPEAINGNDYGVVATVEDIALNESYQYPTNVITGKKYNFSQYTKAELNDIVGL